MMFARRRLLRAIDKDKVEAAVREAERLTSGEIVVSVSPWFWGSVRKAAEIAFRRLGVARTRDRNGILFFIVPGRRQFVVLGDEGIHAKVGAEFWESVASAVSRHFREGNFTQGLLDGIAAVGHQLATHFPYDPEADKNELPDAVDFGSR
jgi:uncharacterized membrane protein